MKMKFAFVSGAARIPGEPRSENPRKVGQSRINFGSIPSPGPGKPLTMGHPTVNSRFTSVLLRPCLSVCRHIRLKCKHAFD